MGIWLASSIDRLTHSIIANTLVPRNSTQFIRVGNSEGKLGLLSLPNVSAFLYPSEKPEGINIAFDGRLYNKQVLCHKLDLDNGIDTGKLIVSIYQRYGFDGIYDLDGAFSLILVDMQKEITLLYRSFLTGFPLYYVAKNNFLSVSTNPVDLLHRSDVSDRLDMEQMSSLFSLDMNAWRDTVYLDLHEVAHGEMVIVSSKGIESKQRPLSEVLVPQKDSTEAEMIDKYRHLVEQAVEKNIFPNTRYGIMLSSGMDSGTLAVFASRILKQYDLTLKAYSWSLPTFPIADETNKIKELCNELDIELTMYDATRFDPFSRLDHMVLQPDIPFSNLYSAMTSELYRVASEDGIDILLNGHYGDELFPSTDNLFIDIMKDKRYELFLPTLKSIINKVGYRDAIEKSHAIRRFIKHYLPFYRAKKPLFTPSEWLSSEAKASRRSTWEDQRNEIEKGYEGFASALSKLNTSSGITRYLTGQFGLERIEPYTNIELLNYTLRLPSDMVYRDGQMKYFAREAMRGLLPESIRTQPRVGLLEQFAYESFLKNSHEVRERLFDDRSAWNVYVDEQWMQKKFKDISLISGKDLLIVWMCLNMAPWQKAIKPGGSLYEGTFMNDRMNG